jgi:hypothetical protein
VGVADEHDPFGRRAFDRAVADVEFPVVHGFRAVLAVERREARSQDLRGHLARSRRL